MLRWGRDRQEGQAATPAAADSLAPARPRPAEGSSLDTPPPTGQSLSQVLVSAGQITPEQLQRALEKQKATGKFIGEILIEDRVIEEDTLISFLAKHCKIPHLSLLDYLIDPEIVKLVPKEICLKYRLLPIDKLGRNLTVAMVNPLDTEALQQVREACPELRIKPILCAFKHFELVTAKVFREEGAGGTPVLSASHFGIRLTPEEKAARERLRMEAEREEREAETTVTPAPGEAPPAPEPAPASAPEAAPDPTPEVLPEAQPEEGPAVEGAPVPQETTGPEAPPAPAPPEEAAENPAAASAMPARPEAPAGAESMFDSIFGAGDATPAQATAATATAAAEDGGMSALMQEMASVMMDSMRDTYSVLARRMDLFHQIDGEAVAKIFARGITQEFEAGQVVFEKGAAGDRLYLILGGGIEIYDGERTMARLGRGELFGEMALISREPRSASARATESTSLLALSHEIIHNMMPPEISIQLLVNIIVTMSKRLRTANEAG